MAGRKTRVLRAVVFNHSGVRAQHVEHVAKRMVPVVEEDAAVVVHVGGRNFFAVGVEGDLADGLAARVVEVNGRRRSPFAGGP